MVSGHLPCTPSDQAAYREACGVFVFLIDPALLLPTQANGFFLLHAGKLLPPISRLRAT